MHAPGVPPPTVNLFGSPFVTWRGVPLVPSDKLLINGHSNVGGTLGSTSILLLRVGEGEQGVVGLQKTGVTGEVEPGSPSATWARTKTRSRRTSSRATSPPPCSPTIPSRASITF